MKRRRREEAWRRADARRAARQRALDRIERRERNRVAKIEASLYAVVRAALRVREARGKRRVIVHWGDRAITALSNAERAVREARRYGSR